LSGKQPRDLDIWAPSDIDRDLLIKSLIERGAKRLRKSAFGDAFEIASRTIEVPFKVEPSRLEDRLARFDIALSAIGVEHLPNNDLRAIIHPLAKTSIERQEILLLKPLVNWKYALTTLERMRRYAQELQFSSKSLEESAVWRVFDAQSEEMQQGMIERYNKTGLGGFAVLEDVKARKSLN
jgi:hypothetical protein